jgi:hypothetical protein
MCDRCFLNPTPSCCPASLNRQVRMSRRFDVRNVRRTTKENPRKRGIRIEKSSVRRRRACCLCLRSKRCEQHRMSDVINGLSSEANFERGWVALKWTRRRGTIILTVETTHR